MISEQGKSLLIVGALLSGASAVGGFSLGRMSAPVPPAEVRYILMPAPVPEPPVCPAPPPKAAEPATAPEPPVEKPAPPPPPPKVAAKPAAKPEPAKKPRAAAPRQRRPTIAECEQMRGAGRSLVMAGGRLRGYSDQQIERALRDCGI